MWEYPARYNCWFLDAAVVCGYLCSMERAAQCEVGSTVRVQSVFHSVAEEANFWGQSCAQSAANVIGNAAAWTTFLPSEPAVSSEGSIKCSDVVSDAFFVLCNCEVKPSSVAFPAVFVASVRIVAPLALSPVQRSC